MASRGSLSCEGVYSSTIYSSPLDGQPHLVKLAYMGSVGLFQPYLLSCLSRHENHQYCAIAYYVTKMFQKSSSLGF